MSILSLIRQARCEIGHHHSCDIKTAVGQCINPRTLHNKNHLACTANLFSKLAHNHCCKSFPHQPNASELTQRADRALANNAGPKEWKAIGREAQDRMDQMELHGRPPARISGFLRIDDSAGIAYDKEMAQLKKLSALAKKRSGGTSNGTGNTGGTNGTAGSSTTNGSTTGTGNSNNTGGTTGSNSTGSPTGTGSTSDSTGSQSTTRFESTANTLNDQINEAKHAYTGNDPEVLKALDNIESLDDQLQKALNEKPQNLEKIKALTEKLSNALDKLGNKFPAGSDMAKLLGKAEASAEKLFSEVKSSISQMKDIKETAEKLNDAINESKHAYEGKMPKDIKDAYDKLEAADDKLQRAINEGKSPKEIRKLAIEVSNLADKLGNKLAADPKQAKATTAMKSAEDLAEKLIGQSSGPSASEGSSAPEKPSTSENPENNNDTVKRAEAREVLDNINPDFRDSKVDDYLREHINRNPDILKYATPEEKAHILRSVIDGRADEGDSLVMLNVLKSINSPEELQKVLNGSGFDGMTGADWLDTKLSPDEKRNLMDHWNAKGETGQQMRATWTTATSRIEG